MMPQASWLEAYGRAGTENDPLASVALFTQDASYYETPFDAPLAGREAIYRYWEAGAQSLADKRASYEILALRDNVGIARWQGQFVVKATGATVTLDCIFLAEFDDQVRCRLFREWWHAREETA